jgi:hypothetical protein
VAPSDWTVDTLKEHVEALDRALDQRINQLLSAALERSATQKEWARMDNLALEKRLEGMNAFRQQITEYQKTTVTRNEFQAELRRLQETSSDSSARLISIVSVVMAAASALLVLVRVH